MDFWAQHKDFILRILAGAGVFLVALIARSITYGDELENEQSRNARLVAEIASTTVAPMPRILELEGDAKHLRDNAAEIARQIGFDLGSNRLEQTLLERILGCTRRYGGPDRAEARTRAAEDFRAGLRENLNGGFGQLRLMVRKELVEEAGEKNIKVAEGIGYENVIALEPDELTQYLLQLELVARVLRYAIDARVDSIEDVRITAGRRDEVIPGANPDFLREYEVTVVFKASQEALRTIVDRLEQEPPRVALTGLRAVRGPEKRLADHLAVEMTLLATASNPEVRFAKE